MKLYDDVLLRLTALLPAEPSKRAAYCETECAPEGEKDSFLMRADMAYELGGGGRASAEAVVFADLDGENSETLLFGPDLGELRSDVPFAHFTIIQLKETDPAALYSEQLKSVGFTVFQLSPAGYHVRISPASCREQVRVAKDALRTNPPLSLINVGNSLIRAFLDRGDVSRVRTIFVTDPRADYKALSSLAIKVKRITDAVQSALQKDGLDCASCNMKPVCDEIDGLRELHFGKEGKK